RQGDGRQEDRREGDGRQEDRREGDGRQEDGRQGDGHHQEDRREGDRYQGDRHQEGAGHQGPCDQVSDSFFRGERRCRVSCCGVCIFGGRRRTITEMRARTSVVIVDDFAPAAEARVLRRAFDERFAEPRSTRADRFVWDWWHVPGQYTALRTPAWTYFPRRVYEQFHRRLVAWGRETLGCHDISPPWLSLYIDGCRQELHGDLPPGPFAFVYSLTNWTKRKFAGGETLMLRDEVLDFWHDFLSVRSVEEQELVRAIEPRLDRLTVFDPRTPHGVRTVTGTRDPREGRLVIHGWFVQPRPFIRGPLPVRTLSARIEGLGDELGASLADLPIAGV